MKKETILYCFCCQRFKKRKWSYEQYEAVLRKIKENKIKIILTTCNDCKKFDGIFAERAAFQKISKH